MGKVGSTNRENDTLIGLYKFRKTEDNNITRNYKRERGVNSWLAERLPASQERLLHLVS
jgi:hypothetical protein